MIRSLFTEVTVAGGYGPALRFSLARPGAPLVPPAGPISRELAALSWERTGPVWGDVEPAPGSVLLTFMTQGG